MAWKNYNNVQQKKYYFIDLFQVYIISIRSRRNKKAKGRWKQENKKRQALPAKKKIQNHNIEIKKANANKFPWSWERTTVIF